MSSSTYNVRPPSTERSTPKSVPTKIVVGVVDPSRAKALKGTFSIGEMSVQAVPPTVVRKTCPFCAPPPLNPPSTA